ncbi:MAG: hypothetical protein IKM97_02785 [Clostridia bacterium]|nr:hypothetical protein [Clostridia bacterium]
MRLQGNFGQDFQNFGAKLLIETLIKVEKGTAPRYKQGEEFSVTKRITKEMAIINWNTTTSKELNNLVRGLNPFLGAYSFLKGKKFKLWSIRIENEELFDKTILEKSEPGKIILSDSKKGLFIKTLDGVISVIEIQEENSKKMGILDFLRGNKIEENNKFQ